MKQLITLLFLFVMLNIQSAWAQELTIKSFAQSAADITASTERRLDGNGDPCALVKVRLALVGATFEGEIRGDVVNHNGEYWVYMLAGSKRLMVKQATVLPLEVNFASHGVNSVEGKNTYVLTLLTPQTGSSSQDDGLRFLSMTVKPTNATVMIDYGQVPVREDGTLMLPMAQGQHTYTVSAFGYASQKDTITISDQKVSLKVTLEPLLTQLTVSCPTEGAAIYINEEKKSDNNSWSGTLSPSTYVIEARKTGYITQRQVVTLQQDKPQSISLPAMIAPMGTLSVSYSPEDAEVWLDGKKLGTSPDIFRNIMVGAHQVEIRKEGFESASQRITIEEGKTATLSGKLLQKGQVQTTSAAIDPSNAQALCEEGIRYFEGNGVAKDYNKAFPYFKQAAEMGYAKAQGYLSECYQNGYGVEKNGIEGEKWSRKAAEQGDALGQNNLGYCYYYGQGVEQNYYKAVKWFRKAARQGNAFGQYNLGSSYQSGLGVEQNYSEAVKWCSKAAEQGYISAQISLGYWYFLGLGVEQNYSEAVKWFRKAAEQGDAEGQNNLGNCYEYGLGVEKNIEEAVRWYQKAAEQGNENAKTALNQLGK